MAKKADNKKTKTPPSREELKALSGQAITKERLTEEITIIMESMTLSELYEMHSKALELTLTPIWFDNIKLADVMRETTEKLKELEQTKQDSVRGKQ